MVSHGLAKAITRVQISVAANLYIYFQPQDVTLVIVDEFMIFVKTGKNHFYVSLSFISPY